eukprot:scaffold1220_cov259-Pinguiococcus_pyrenoidosus.AAC.118
MADAVLSAAAFQHPVKSLRTAEENSNLLPFLLERDLREDLVPVRAAELRPELRVHPGDGIPTSLLVHLVHHAADHVAVLGLHAAQVDRDLHVIVGIHVADDGELIREPAQRLLIPRDPVEVDALHASVLRRPHEVLPGADESAVPGVDDFAEHARHGRDADTGGDQHASREGEVEIRGRSDRPLDGHVRVVARRGDVTLARRLSKVVQLRQHFVRHDLVRALALPHLDGIVIRALLLPALVVREHPGRIQVFQPEGLPLLQPPRRIVRIRAAEIDLLYHVVELPGPVARLADVEAQVVVVRSAGDGERVPLVLRDVRNVQEGIRARSVGLARPAFRLLQDKDDRLGRNASIEDLRLVRRRAREARNSLDEVDGEGHGDPVHCRGALQDVGLPVHAEEGRPDDDKQMVREPEVVEGLAPEEDRRVRNDHDHHHCKSGPTGQGGEKVPVGRIRAVELVRVAQRRVLPVLVRTVGVAVWGKSGQKGPRGKRTPDENNLRLVKDPLPESSATHRKNAA